MNLKKRFNDLDKNNFTDVKNFRKYLRYVYAKTFKTGIYVILLTSFLTLFLVTLSSSSVMAYGLLGAFLGVNGSSLVVNLRRMKRCDMLYDKTSTLISDANYLGDDVRRELELLLDDETIIKDENSALNKMIKMLITKTESAIAKEEAKRSPDELPKQKSDKKIRYVDDESFKKKPNPEEEPKYLDDEILKKPRRKKKIRKR